MERFFFKYLKGDANHWLLVVCAVAFLHLFFVKWVTSQLRLPFSPHSKPPSFTVSLIHDPGTAESPTEPPARAPVEPRISKPAPSDNKPSAPKTSADPRAIAISSATSARRPTPALAGTPVARELSDFEVALPPSAELKFSVLTSLRGLRTTSNGSILWMRSNNQFSNIHGTIGDADSPLWRFHSEGIIDRQQGIVPRRYTEQRANQSESSAIFQDDTTIHLSESSASYKKFGGEQDIASVIWQIAGIGRHDGSAFVPSLHIPITIVTTDSVRLWHFRVLALEDVKTPLGNLPSWHLSGMTSIGFQEHSLDLWLAPNHNWYPVKVRYAEPGGDFLELLISEIQLVPDT